MRMPIGRIVWPALYAIAWLVATAAWPEAKPEAQAMAKGKLVYARYCVACHGPEGRGNGPLAKDLSVPVPDLTTLATRASGQFPFDRVQRVIELGEPLKGHGSSDMPAWGDAFKRTKGIEAATPKEAIRNVSLYLSSIQRQPEK
jgi:mono/diheme cytochrome c family protein